MDSASRQRGSRSARPTGRRKRPGAKKQRRRQRAHRKRRLSGGTPTILHAISQQSSMGLLGSPRSPNPLIKTRSPGLPTRAPQLQGLHQPTTSLIPLPTKTSHTNFLHCATLNFFLMHPRSAPPASPQPRAARSAPSAALLFFLYWRHAGRPSPCRLADFPGRVFSGPLSRMARPPGRAPQKDWRQRRYRTQ